jgi:hypothetical protein
VGPILAFNRPESPILSSQALSVTSRSANLSPVLPARHSEGPAGAGSDRRADERLSASDLAWLTSVRLKYGPAVWLIDLSRGGTQIETTSYRLHPGTTVVVEIAGTEGEFAIPARVLRCEIAGLTPCATYRGALVFKRPFMLPVTRKEEVGDASLLHEHAKLSLALRRFGERDGNDPKTGCNAVTNVGAGALAAALAMIESQSGQGTRSRLTREVSRLFAATTRWIDGGAVPDVLLAEMSELLRRSVPARAIRLVDAATPINGNSADAVYFDVPSADHRPAARLLIEFPREYHLEQWHLQLLKTAAQLIALIREIERIRERVEPLAEEESPAPPLGWNRLVVRCMDGRLLKGYGRDFMPARGHVHVWSAPEGPLESRVTVPIRHLKAVFFVRDFNGDPPGLLPRVEGSLNNGRRIIVTFLDGEVLTGATLNYTPEGPGFFVLPLEEKSNNHRIFVVQEAIRHVQFP